MQSGARFVPRAGPRPRSDPQKWSVSDTSHRTFEEWDGGGGVDTVAATGPGDVSGRSSGEGSTLQAYDKLYIDGEWVPSFGTETIEVINASTEDVMGSIPSGTAADVDRAVTAAVAAFDDWSACAPKDRAGYVQRISEELGARSEEIAQTIAGEVGMPIFLSRLVQAGLPQAVSGSMVAIAADFPWEEQIGNSLVIQEPVGVVGCITPWNYPLHQIVAKVAPALVAGSTVVLKPSEVAPLNAFIFADIIDEVGPAQGRVQPRVGRRPGGG